MATFDRTRQEIDKFLTDSTVLHAVVGVGDLAVAKLRETHSDLSARTGNFDPKIIREQAQATLVGRVSSAPHDVKAAPQQVKALPEKAQAVIGDAVVSALTAYGDLANRGRVLVDRIRSQPQSGEMQEQAETTLDPLEDVLDRAGYPGAAIDEPTVIDESAVTGEHVFVVDPALAEPAVMDEAAVLDEPAVTGEHVFVVDPALAEPAVMDELAVLDEAAAIDEPAVTEEAFADSSLDGTAAVEEPAAAHEQPIDEQAVTDDEDERTGLQAQAEAASASTSQGADDARSALELDDAEATPMEPVDPLTDR